MAFAQLLAFEMDHDDDEGSLEHNLGPYNTLKRPFSPPAEEDDANSQAEHNQVQDQDTYGAAKFGDFGQYMRRKRAKLQIQNAEIEGGETIKSTMFKGLAIYINGKTEPPLQELRKLIMENGGIFHAYLDRKSLVTHVITTSLTPAKVREFQHMKIVTPNWIMDSLRDGGLKPWREYVFKPGERADEAQGRSAKGKTLLEIITRSKQEQEPSKAITPSKPSTSDKYASNTAAEHAMRSSEWRAAHTAAAGSDFIDGYYKNSRLHHLSMWKSELKKMVSEAREKADLAFEKQGRTDDAEYGSDMGGTSAAAASDVGRAADSMIGAEITLNPLRSPKSKWDNGKGKSKAMEVDPDDDEDQKRTIMHCDFDCFFVSAGLISRPELRGKPVAVCHSQGSGEQSSAATGAGGSRPAAGSTSEIASANYEAREFGVKNGMVLRKARELCPSLITIPYEFERYKEISLKFYTILAGYADDLQAVSVDEALVDVSGSVRGRHVGSQSSIVESAQSLAETIRSKVRRETGCEVSIGISHNIMLARLATKKAKPAGSYYLRLSEYPAVIQYMSIDALHGFGYHTREKAVEKLGTAVLGELIGKSKAQLCEALGKGTGETLYNALRGVDERKVEGDAVRKSVSCDVNYGIRFENNVQASKFVFELAEEVSRRLREIGKCGRSLTVKVMKRDPKAPMEPVKFLGHGPCDVFNRQVQIFGPGGKPTSDAKIIGDYAWKLIKQLGFDPNDLRGIGIQIQKLEDIKAASSNSHQKEVAQAVLPFRRTTPVAGPSGLNKKRLPSAAPAAHSVKVIDIDDDEICEVAAPAKPALDLPSFSQVDKSVFDALPPEIREELEAAFHRQEAEKKGVGRSTSTAPIMAAPSRHVTPAFPAPMSRSATPAAANGSRANTPTANSPSKAQAQALERITRQLAPRSRPSVSPTKGVGGVHPLFAKRTFHKPTISVSDEELRKFGIDVQVFRALPEELQREQLSGARFAAKHGQEALRFDAPKKVLKVVEKKRQVPPDSARKWSAPPVSPIKRKIVNPPSLKLGASKGGKGVMSLESTEEVQNALTKWMDKFKDRPPKELDVKFFRDFLLKCVDRTRSTDVGLEKAVCVLRWWAMLLRRRWEEGFEGDLDGVDEIGKAWWKAFRDAIDVVNEVVVRNFGSKLAI